MYDVNYAVYFFMFFIPPITRKERFFFLFSKVSISNLEEYQV